LSTIRLTVAYDGTSFAGFQVQVGQRTVQATLQEALGRIFDTTVQVVGAGRTDAGVHATGQVVSFRVRSDVDLARLHRAVNAVLPEDVAVVDARDTPAGFHARYSARGRSYRYAIWNAPERPVLARRYVYHWRADLDVEAMDAAARALVGRHDFAAFCGSLQGRDRPTDTMRTLFRLHCWRDGERVLIDATADAFLPRMVRNLVGALLRVGHGQASADQTRDILDRRDRSLAGRAAPVHGLCLTRVWYD
jgi:tRNA pseudouridine38-40 synthase